MRGCRLRGLNFRIVCKALSRALAFLISALENANRFGFILLLAFRVLKT